MTKLIFFLSAYPLKRKFQLLALLIFETLKVPVVFCKRIFGKSLVESRAILGFIHDNTGKIESSSSQSMVVSFLLYNKMATVKLRWRSSDFLVFEQVFIKEEYAPVTKYKIRTDSVILDCGANVGFTTLYFKHRFIEARIFAIEPDPSNFNVLLENINKNGLTGVECLNYALWHSNDYVKLDRNSGDSRDWSIKVSDEGQIEVKSKKLNTLMHELNIERLDVLKMDIEGAELDIFERDKEIEGVLDFIDVVAIEIHGDTNRIIEKMLTRKGFHFFTSNETTFASKIR